MQRYKRELYRLRRAVKMFTFFEKKNQNLWGNPPLNICENIPPSSSYLTFRPTSAGARFRLAIFRGSVYPRQSK